MNNLSKEAKAKIVEWDYKYKEERERISWDEYFIDMAFKVAKRSHDPQTQCGAIIVSKSREVLATGYNGFVGGINDEILPNLRPEKYLWMIHAEHNAILNCAKNGVKLKGATIYVTGPPCIYCLQYIYQSGIDEIIHGGMTTKGKYEDHSIEQEIFKELVKGKLSVRVMIWG